jgi:predicted nucleic acid-binding protein
VSGEIFLDSGIFVAFLSRRDRRHQAAEVSFSGSPLHQ